MKGQEEYYVTSPAHIVSACSKLIIMPVHISVEKCLVSVPTVIKLKFGSHEIFVFVATDKHS